MNNNNIIYQLREADGTSTENGEWTSALKKPIILEDQDQLILNKAVVDSRSLDSGDISLETDYEFTFDYNYYLVNWNNDSKINNSGSAQTSVDNFPYILMSGHTTTSGGAKDVEKITKITWQSVVSGSGSMILTYNYRDLNNTEQTTNIRFIYPDSDGNNLWSTKGATRTPFSLMCLKGTFKLADTDENNKIKNNLNLSDQSITKEEIPAGNTLYEPYRKSVSVSMSKGQYNPADFAERISAEITKIPTNQGFPTTNLTGNDILASTGYDFYDASGTGLRDTGARFFRGDGTNSFALDSIRTGTGVTQETWFGTSQFALEYDADTGKFKFSALNMPFFDSAGNISVQFKEITGTTDFVCLNKNSGVVLSDLKAKKINDNGTTEVEPDWWNRVLGFNIGDVCVSYEYVFNSNATGTDAHYPLFTLTDGINTTGGETGVDVAVYKNDPSGNWYKVPTTFPVTNVTLQNEIFAEEPFGSQTFTFGYYLVSVEGIQGDLVTEQDVKTTIQGVVSRYYEVNNYSYGTDADAIIYTHRGATLYLNQLKCRILDSNYNVPAGIGADNTIFIQHRKAQVALDQGNDNKDRY